MAEQSLYQNVYRALSGVQDLKMPNLVEPRKSAFPEFVYDVTIHVTSDTENVTHDEPRTGLDRILHLGGTKKVSTNDPIVKLNTLGDLQVDGSVVKKLDRDSNTITYESEKTDEEPLSETDQQASGHTYPIEKVIVVLGKSIFQKKD